MLNHDQIVEQFYWANTMQTGYIELKIEIKEHTSIHT